MNRRATSADFLDTRTFCRLQAILRDTEYWLGYQNFYVITRYNRSSFYAMTVFQFAEALRSRHAH